LVLQNFLDTDTGDFHMCGRFTLEIPSETLAEMFGLAEHPVVLPRYNVAPTQQVPVIRESAEGGNRLDYLQWGLIPSWSKERSVGYKMINARSETVTEKPSFRQALRYRRCLVLASGFYEWRQEGKTKLPHYLHIRDNSPMVFAGLWETWNSPEGETVESCTILTTAANSLVAAVHDRMPVILHPDGYRTWLDRNLTDTAGLSRLFQPYPADLMEIRPVSQLVNSPKNDMAQLIERFEDVADKGLVNLDGLQNLKAGC
jgi:putative SOS response-associated peptidase YedK